MDTRKYLAELFGTFLFLTIGYSAVAAFTAADVPGILVVSFAFPLGLLAAIFAFGHISGGHFNPAVTIAAVLDGRTSLMNGIAYIVAQLIGAIAAGAVVLVVATQSAVAAGVTKPGGGVSDLGALVLETVLTAIFVLVILTSTKRAPSFAPVAIPFTLIGIHFASVPLSGASVNPARSLGSALVGGDLGALWIYVVAPVVGAVIAWAVYRGIDGGGDEAFD
jgi:aquaporin Z